MTLNKAGPGLLRVAGVVAWLSSGAPAIALFVQRPNLLGPERLGIWMAAFLVFGAAFWRASTALGESLSRTALLASLAIQSAAALAMLQMICTGFESVLLIVVAAQLGLFLAIKPGLLWIAAQTVLVGWFLAGHWILYAAVRWTVATAGFELFALLLASLARREAHSRVQLARANAELRATRQLLAQSSRLSERVRIARDLHDVLGHGLAALSLNLEVASHVSPAGRARDAVSKAQGIAKQLLADVRRVVSTLRNDRAIDVASAVEALTDGVERPMIHLTVPDELEVADSERAQVLLRCVQEAITNAIRHAHADHLWIELDADDGGFYIRAEDDGRGVDSVPLGNGLRGMKERLDEVGGWLEVESAAGGGFRLKARLPPTETNA